MPAKDSGTSGSNPASQLERCSCTREQPMAAGPVAGLLNSSKKKKGCAKEEIKHPKRKTSSSGSKIKSTQKLVKERLQKEHVENAPASSAKPGKKVYSASCKEGSHMIAEKENPITSYQS